MRADPRLFYKTVVKNYPSKSGNVHVKDYDEYKSLLSDMNKQKPLPLLYPDPKLFTSAVCHATSSGQRAYVGHRRSDGCKSFFDAECCDYGRNSPLDIIMGLLVDHGVKDLGHRKVLMSAYNKVGVSIKPHKEYGTNTVLDFGF